MPRFDTNRASFLYLLLISGAILSACSGGVPSEGDARDVFATEFSKEVEDGLFEIDSFKKTNAQEGEMFGVKFYTIEYEATVRWPKGLNTQCLGNDKDFKGWNCWMVKTRQIGEVEEFKGEITFESTEKGWKGKNGQVY